MTSAKFSWSTSTHFTSQSSYCTVMTMWWLFWGRMSTTSLLKMVILALAPFLNLPHGWRVWCFPSKLVGIRPKGRAKSFTFDKPSCYVIESRIRVSGHCDTLFCHHVIEGDWGGWWMRISVAQVSFIRHYDENQLYLLKNTMKTTPYCVGSSMVVMVFSYA